MKPEAMIIALVAFVIAAAFFVFPQMAKDMEKCEANDGYKYIQTNSGGECVKVQESDEEVVVDGVTYIKK